MSLRILIGVFALVAVLGVALAGCAQAPIVVPAPNVTINIPAQAAPAVGLTGDATGTMKDLFQFQLMKDMLGTDQNQGGWGGGGGHGGHGGHGH